MEHGVQKTASSAVENRLEMSFGNPVTADSVRVSPGWFDKRYWAEYNRIKKMRIEVNGETVRGFFTDAMTPQFVSLGKEMTFSKIRFVVKEVSKTSKWDDTCIAEIEFYNAGT